MSNHIAGRTGSLVVDKAIDVTTQRDRSDATQAFVMEELLTPELRREINNSEDHLDLLEGRDADFWEEPFLTLFGNSVKRWVFFERILINDNWPKLPKKYAKLLGPYQPFNALLKLSGTAHALGQTTSNYSIGTGISGWITVYRFTKGVYHWEQRVFDKYKEVEKRVPCYRDLPSLPPRKTPPVNGFTDFAENTTYTLPMWDTLAIFRTGEKKTVYIDDALAAEGRRIGPEDEDLRSIAASPSLQVQKVLEWAQYHIEKLENIAIRTRIFDLLFEYGKLPAALADSPDETIHLMTLFIDKGIECFKQGANLDALLWLCRIQFFLYRHVQTAQSLHGFQVQRDWPAIWPILEKKYDTARSTTERSKIAAHFVMTFYDVENLSLNDGLVLLRSTLYSRFYTDDKTVEPKTKKADNSIEAMIGVINEVWEKYRRTIQQGLEKCDPETRSKHMDMLIQQSFDTQHKEDTWILSDNLVRSLQRNYTIHLETGKCLSDGATLLDYTHGLANDPTLKFLSIDPLTLSPLSHSQKGDNRQLIHSLDGHFELAVKTNGQGVSVVQSVTRYITIGDEKIGFVLPREPKKQTLQNGGIEHLPFSRKLECKYWISSDDGRFLLAEPAHDDHSSPHAYLHDGKSESTNWICLRQIEPHRYEYEGRLLLDLMHHKTPSICAWEKWLKGKKIHIDDISLLGRLTEKQSEARIETVELRVLGLSFTNVNDRLQCDDFPGFYLSGRQSPPQFNGPSTVIVLENDHHQEKYLLPAVRRHEPGMEPLDTTKLFKTERGKSYLAYELDREGELSGDCLEADFYLLMIYKAQGDYKRAAHCLKGTRHYQNNSEIISELTNELLQQKDHTSFGAALDCKIACRMYRHTKLWSAQQNRWTLPEELRPYIGEQLERYQNAVSSRKEGINAIPRWLRLDRNEIEQLQEVTQYTLTDDGHSSQKAKGSIALYRDENGNHMATVTNYAGDSRTVNISTIKGVDGHNGVLSKNLPKNVSKLRLVRIAVQAIKIYRAGDKQNTLDEQEFARWVMENYRQNLSGSPFTLQPNQALYNMRAITSFFENNKIDKFFASLNKNTKTNQVESHTERVLNPIDDPQPYLLRYFIPMFAEAISDDPSKRQFLKIELYNLLENSFHFPQIPTPISCLLIVLEHPDQFKKLGPFKENEDCLRAILKHLPKPKAPSPAGTIKLIENVALPNPLLETHPLTFRIGTIDKEGEYKHPLQALVSHHISVVEKNITEGEFPLSESGMPDVTPLEKKLLARYQSGHTSNLNTKRPIYHLNPASDLTSLRGALKKQQEADRETLDQLKSKLKEDGNITAPSSAGETRNETESYLFQEARDGQQLQRIEIQDLIGVLLNQDTSFLTKNNRFLTQQDVESILSTLCHYALVQSRIDQAAEALALIPEKAGATLDSYEQHRLGSVLDKKREYDVRDYPEFLVYEYATKRTLRSDQYKILTKLISSIEGSDRSKANNYGHYLLQFAAGGGKTAVLIPILAQRFARKGFLPVIFNTNELYNIGVPDISERLRVSFSQDMKVLERDLEHPWTTAELVQLRNDLERWRSKGNCLPMKPVTWHSIHIAKKLAYASDPLLAKAAEAVLDFLKDHAVKLEDEVHLISDPLQETIKTHGPKLPIPHDQQQLLMRYYDYLMGHRDDCKQIAKMAGMTEKSKKTIPPKLLEQIQGELIERIVKEDFWTTLDCVQFKSYLEQTDRKRPQWLLTLNQNNPALADLVVLARAFVRMHLPHILKMQFGKDYGKSMHKGDLTAAPKHDGEDVTTHFSDQILIAALTIQLYNQEGIEAEWIKAIINELTASHQKERKLHQGKTLAGITLERIVPKPYWDQGEHLDPGGLSQSKIEVISSDQRVQHYRPMIDEFLYTRALRQIRKPEHRVTSTPADFQAGFLRSVYFTATPGLLETYPVFLDHSCSLLDQPFEAEVITALFQKRNASSCLIDLKHSPEDFFSQLNKDHADLFNELTTLIDRGALLSGNRAQKVISAYLDCVKATNPAATTLYFDERQMVIESGDPKVGRFQISGTDLHQALRRKGITPEELLLFLFLDLSKTTGTDVKRPHKDRAGLTVGKEQTVTETIQAAMRERQLLFDDAQTIVWISFKALYAEINPNANGQFDLWSVFYWMVRNEGQQIKTKVIMRAYQGIHQQIESIIWNKIKGDPTQYEQYDNVLQETHNQPVFSLYEIESAIADSSSVLRNYKEELCRRFSLTSGRLPNHVTVNIKSIIEQTAAIIQDMRQPHGSELNSQVCQEQQAEVEEEQRQEQQLKTRLSMQKGIRIKLETYLPNHDQLSKIFTPKSRPGGYAWLSTTLHSGKLRLCCTSRTNKAGQPTGEIKTPALLICADHFSPIARTSRRNRHILEWLKPIHTLVAEIKQGKCVQFLACTAAGAEFFRHQISQHPGDSNNGYAVIGELSHVLFASKNLSPATKAALESQQELKNMAIYAALLSGRLRNPHGLVQMMTTYEWDESKLRQLFDAIGAIYVSKHEIDLSSFYNLLKNIQQYEKAPIPGTHGDEKIPAQTFTERKLLGARFTSDTLEQVPTSVFPESVISGKKPKPHPDPERKIIDTKKELLGKLENAQKRLKPNWFVNCLTFGLWDILSGQCKKRLALGAVIEKLQQYDPTSTENTTPLAKVKFEYKRRGTFFPCRTHNETKSIQDVSNIHRFWFSKGQTRTDALLELSPPVPDRAPPIEQSNS